jgi:hypothetical protein
MVIYQNKNTGRTAHNETVELVLLCQKCASKWVFYSCFMVLSEGKFVRKRLIRQSQQDCICSAPVGRSGVPVG